MNQSLRRWLYSMLIGCLAMLVGCATVADHSTSTVPPGTATPPNGGTPAPIVATDWPTYHLNAQRTGYLAGFRDPQQLTAAWHMALDGAVYAEPLVVKGKLYVATEHDTLYALDAHTGQILWHTNVGDPAPRATLPCGDIDPLGITGTPVYDAATNAIFAVAEVTGPSHILVGIDATSGQVKLRRNIDPPGMAVIAHQERGALALAGGIVYVPFGGLDGDCGPYHGWVIGVPTTGNAPLMSYQVPTQREGGIWTPPGPSIDAHGNIFVSVGNGDATSGTWDHSDSILRLSPMTLQVADGFAPTSWPQENANDADLGSLGPVLLADDWLIADGKAGTTYLLKQDALGGVGGQQARQDFGCVAFGGAATIGDTAFLPCTSGVAAVAVQSGATLVKQWQIHAPGSPVIGGRTVYTIDNRNTLVAVNIADGSPRASINVGTTSRFATPTLYDGMVYVGTNTGVSAVLVR